MLFPIIWVVDNDSQRKTPHLVGTNSHDLLKIDEESGGIQYENIQCCEGTKKYDGKSTFSFSGVNDDYWGPSIEMVTFERLCKIYLEQTRMSAEQEKRHNDVLKKIMEEHDRIIHKNGLDGDDIPWNSGGVLL